MPAIPLCRFTSGGAILSFHSVTTPDLPAEGDAHLPLGVFESLIGVACCLGELVPLGDLVRRHVQGRSTSGLIAVTLDDAYAALGADFRDVIARKQTPVTVFAVGEAAATGATYWWDRVDDLFPRVAPDRWRTFETACGLPDTYRRGQPRDYGPLRPLRQWLLAAYAGRWPAHLEPALRDLEEEVGWRTRHRSMTFDELDDLMATGLVEVGVHTLSHPVLPLLPDSDLRHEIAAGHDALRERFGTVLPVLAVPFGLYDRRTLRAARSAGMIASLTLAGGTLADADPRDSLPRICLTRRDTRARLGLRLLGLPALVRSWMGRRPALYPDLPSPTT